MAHSSDKKSRRSGMAWISVVAAVLLASLSAGSTSMLAQGPYPCPGASWQLCPDEEVGEGEFIVANGGWYDFGVFCYEEAWCAVVMRFNGSAFWVDYIDTGAVRMIMQAPGNLVIYDDSWVPLWATPTAWNYGAWLNVQDAGNAVIYDEWGNALWATSD